MFEFKYYVVSISGVTIAGFNSREKAYSYVNKLNQGLMFPNEYRVDEI